MIRELEPVVLCRDLEEHCLRKGDVGTVVHVYSGGKAFEVEFLTANGRTLAVLTLEENDIRPRQPNEILHVREVAPTN